MISSQESSLGRSGSILYVELMKFILPISFTLFIVSLPLFDVAPAIALSFGHMMVTILRTAAMFSHSRYDHFSFPLLAAQGLFLILVQGWDFPALISVVFSSLVSFRTDRLQWVSSSSSPATLFDVFANGAPVAISSGIITGGLLTYSLASALLHVAIQISVLFVRAALLRRWASRDDLAIADTSVSLVSSHMRPGAPLAVWMGLLWAIAKGEEIPSIPALQPDTPSDFRLLITKVPVKDQISRVGCLCELATRNFHVDTARAQQAAIRELRIMADRLGERKLRELAPDPEKLSKILSF